MDHSDSPQKTTGGPGASQNGSTTALSIVSPPFTPQHQRPTAAQEEEDSSKKPKIPWTPEEDEILKKAVEMYKGRAWKQVAELLPGRTHSQAAHRWQKVLDPKLKKGAWTQEEDDQLQKAVEEMGEGHWSRVAERVGSRNGKQCRERWRNQISPDVDKRPWSEDEDNGIIRLFTDLGPKWAEIAKHFPGRTENAVKNRWNAKLGRPNGSNQSPSPATPNALRRAQNKASASSDTPKPKRSDAGQRRSEGRATKNREDRQLFAVAASPSTPSQPVRLSGSSGFSGSHASLPTLLASLASPNSPFTLNLRQTGQVLKPDANLKFAASGSSAFSNPNGIVGASDSQMPPLYPMRKKAKTVAADNQQTTAEALLALKGSPLWQ